MLTGEIENLTYLSGFPANWETMPLKSLCFRITSGGTPSRKNPDFYKNGTIIWLKTQELKDWYIDDSQEKITEEALKKSSAKLLPPDTVLMAMYGDGVTITSLGILRKQATTNQACCALIPDLNVIKPLYLLYLLKFHKNHLIKLALGGAQRNLSVTIISNFKVKTPPLPTQRKIVGILSAYDELIENNTRRIEILEEMARILYREWFVKFRFPGHENVRFVESELGLIPEDWEVIKLPEICSKVIDGTHDSPKPVSEGYHLITGKHIINGFINFRDSYFITTEEHEKVMKRSKPEKGDTILSNIGTLGSVAIVDQDFEFSIKNVALFKPLKKNYSNFIFLHFSLVETIEDMERKASGTSQRFFSLKFLRDYELIKPPESLLSKFDDLIEPIIKKRSLLNQKNTNLRKTRDLLLPTLISGEIDVEDLDINTGDETV